MSADETSAQSVDDPDADINRDDERILSAEDVGKRFSGLQALDNVDMTVNHDEIIGLIESNGAGRTTLFNCISRAFPLTSGAVRLDGEVISGLPAHKIARAGLARVSQITRSLKELAVVENAMVDAHIHARRRSETREVAMEGLEFVGFADKTEEEASELTVGAQEHLKLVRAVSTRLKILPLGEITAGLAPSGSNQVLDLFRRLRGRGTSLLIVEHDMKAIMDISDYVKVPNQGKGTAFGAPETVVEDDRVIEAYVGGFDIDA